MNLQHAACSLYETKKHSITRSHTHGNTVDRTKRESSKLDIYLITKYNGGVSTTEC